MRPSRPTRTLLATAASLTVIGAVAGGCAGTGGERTGPGSAAPSAGAPASGPAAPSGGAGPTASAAVRLTFTVKGGKATPPFRQVSVPLGRTVSLTVTSDAQDAVHVHGYDKEAELEPGVPATITFTADQAGQFEVETHESGLRLASLVVR